MTHQEFSRKGGKSKSKKKMDAMLENLKQARIKLALKRKLKKVKDLEDWRQFVLLKNALDRTKYGSLNAIADRSKTCLSTMLKETQNRADA